MSHRFLLDTNILVAVLDENHLHHERARSWFESIVDTSTWLSCPITINGAIRLLINPRITSAAPTADVAADRFADLARNSSHEFVTDDFNLADSSTIKLAHISSHSQVTDVYLLGLAVRHQAVFATMDQKVNVRTVAGGDDAYLVIP